MPVFLPGNYERYIIGHIQEIIFMKKLFIVSFAVLTLGLGSCGSSTGADNRPADTVSAAATSIDSAANNGVIPPSAAPGNAGNSSLADTAYKADSTKKK
jgi:hypothetical protein